MSLNRTKYYLILSTACLVGYIWLYYGWATNATANAGIDVCFIKNTTGIPCPSCGTTRALLALMHGGLFESLYINPMGILAGVALLILPLWILLDVAMQRQSLLEWYIKANQWLRLPVVATILVGIMAANWIWNITKGL